MEHHHNHHHNHNHSYKEKDRSNGYHSVRVNDRICGYTPYLYVMMIILLCYGVVEFYRTSFASPQLRASATIIDIPNISSEKMSKINHLLVIPGGGGGGAGSSSSGYPEWTRRRVLKVIDVYQSLSEQAKEETLILSQELPIRIFSPSLLHFCELSFISLLYSFDSALSFLPFFIFFL